MNGPSRTGYQPLDEPYRPRDRSAPFVQRAGALVLDAVVAFVCVPLPVQVYFLLTGRGGLTCTWNGDTEVCLTDPGDARLSRVMFWTLASVFVLCFSWAISRRRTLGQAAVGIRVKDTVSGAPVSFGRALLRTVAMALSLLPLGLGFWWALIDRDRRTWHDIIARTTATAV